ncbi:Replication factor A protein 3 [Cladobotryum mycophilum]|uniref:Replication factor A protein 3 n=1 Tax=Cladobotryum mycophilum TaxID=491253 RepID=A0ABR0SPB3_9HYPO
MAEQLSTPRITAAYLDNFVGKVVTIVGKVTQLLGEQAVIDADGNVTIHLTRDSHLANGNAAQIIGKVNPDLSIKALSTRDVGPGVDMALCTLVAEITHQHKAIFISDN